MNHTNTLQHLSPFKIRTIRENDRPQWERLYSQYAEFYHVPMNDGILETTWSWLMSIVHPQEGIVAVLPTGEIVGLAHFRPFPKPLLGKEAGFLDDLFVSSDRRGIGIGHALLECVSAIAFQRGWPLVRWITAIDNVVAQRLYDRAAKSTQWITYDLAPAMPFSEHPVS